MATGLNKEFIALNLGGQIRQLRLQKSMTLQNVSDITGLSKPLLSQIENNVAAPPIATLLKISKAFNVNLGYFFQETVAADRIDVLHKEDRFAVMRRVHEETASVGYHYEYLTHPMTNKHMEPFMVEIEPRAEEDLIFYQHRGEEFLFILDGRLEFRGGDKIIQLEQGDSLYFDANISHALRGLEGQKVKVLAVIYNPE
jgi:transcriptional regulator with XRE-family HTH domain